MHLALNKNNTMAHHKSAKKRIRQSAKQRLSNRYSGKTARNLVRDIRESHDKKEAAELLPKAISNIDKLAKKNIIHWKKAANLKSKLTRKVAKM